MAAILSTILDRMKDLVAGSTTSTTMTVTAGRFMHCQWPVEVALEHSAAQPYPFELVVDNGVWPALEGAKDSASYYRWSQAHVLLRVGYAMALDAGYDLRKTICDHEYEIHRCLTDPDSWTSTTGWSGCERGSWSIREVSVGQGDDVTDMLVLEALYRVLYVEDTQ